MQKGVESPNIIGGNAKVGDVVLYSLPQAMENAVKLCGLLVFEPRGGYCGSCVVSAGNESIYKREGLWKVTSEGPRRGLRWKECSNRRTDK